MKTIEFLDESYKDIIARSKVQIIRKGIRDFSVDDDVVLKFPSEPALIATVKNVKYVEFRNLTLEDASPNEFKTLDDLKSTIINIYNSGVIYDYLTVIEFELVVDPKTYIIDTTAEVKNEQSKN